MTTNGDDIVIPLSKVKLILMTLGSFTFVCLGIVFVIKPETFLSSVMRSKEVIFVTGLASISFFGLAGLFILKKLFDNQPGLVVSREGIFDNSSATSAGLIEWNDIVDADLIKIFGQRIFLINVKDPQKYIQRQESTRRRNVLKANLKFYGTPITIAANGLKINFEQLQKLLTEKIRVNQQ